MTPTRHPPPSTAAVIVALLTVYIVWGSTYFAIAVMVETMPPLLSAGVRFVVAGILMLGALIAHARLRGGTAKLERPTGAMWRTAIIVGTLLLLGGNGGVVLAELRIPSGVAAVLIATVPIWLALLDAIITRQRPSRLVVAGLIVGIVGVAILLVPVEGVDGLDPIGILLVIGSSLAWSIGSVYARHAPLPRSNLLSTGMEMLAGGIALLAAGALLGEIGRADFSTFSTRSLVATAYLVFVGSIAGYTAYTWLLAHVPVSTAGTYAYVNPIVAVALGAIFLAEPITPRTVVAAVLIIGAVVAMVSGRSRQAEERVPDREPAPLEPDEGVASIVRPRTET